MALVLHCPTCGNEIVKEHEGRLKVRTKLLIGSPDGAVHGLCRNCGLEMRLPLTLSITEPRLFVAPHRS